jgi:hypothetical protein
MDCGIFADQNVLFLYTPGEKVKKKIALPNLLRQKKYLPHVLDQDKRHNFICPRG